MDYIVIFDFVLKSIAYLSGGADTGKKQLKKKKMRLGGHKRALLAVELFRLPREDKEKVCAI